MGPSFLAAARRTAATWPGGAQGAMGPPTPAWVAATAERAETRRAALTGKGAARWQEAANARAVSSGAAHAATEPFAGQMTEPETEPRAGGAAVAAEADTFRDVWEDLALVAARFEPHRSTFMVEGRPVQVFGLKISRGTGVPEYCVCIIDAHSRHVATSWVHACVRVCVHVAQEHVPAYVFRLFGIEQQFYVQMVCISTSCACVPWFARVCVSVYLLVRARCQCCRM